MAKSKVNPLTFFREEEQKRKDNFQNSGTTTTGVINDYDQKFEYGKTGSSYMSKNPAPAFKKGGAKKC